MITSLPANMTGAFLIMTAINIFFTMQFVIIAWSTIHIVSHILIQAVSRALLLTYTHSHCVEAVVIQIMVLLLTFPISSVPNANHSKCFSNY